VILIFLKKLSKNNVNAYKIGETVDGYGKVECIGKVNYKPK